MRHFLYTCPRWRDQRTALREAHGPRFSDISFAVGGYSARLDSDPKNWTPDKEAMMATVRFAMATKRLTREEHSTQEEERVASDDEDDEADIGITSSD